MMKQAWPDPEKLLKTYPRFRPELPPLHKEIYEREYKLNRQGTSFMFRLSHGLEAWMHRKVASLYGDAVLEIGAGTLNHLPYESSVKNYDIVEPFRNLYLGNPDLERIRNRYDFIQEVSKETRYSRIISIAVLEHITDLPDVLATAHDLLTDDGVFQAGIPCEGGFMWGVGWRMSTCISYRLRTGLSYKTIMSHEHVNSCPEILTLVKYFFRRVNVSYYPLPFFHGGFYAYLEAYE